jgi:hypothetical protein
MPDSVQKDRHGPDWPIGFIQVVSPGTPVEIMSLVDPTDINEPENAVGGSTISGGAVTGNEYTERAQQIFFQAYKPGAGRTGAVRNTGNIYIMREGVQGSGNRSDMGSIVFILEPGQTFFLASAPLNRDVFSPWRYSIDADIAGDGAFVCLIMQ